MIAQIDSTILQDFKAGKEKAFSAVFHTLIRPITFFCIKLTGNKEDGEEIAVQTFHKLINLHYKFETEANIKAFLYITARNACIDFHRSNKRQLEKQKELTQALLTEKAIEHQVIQSEIMHIIYQEIKKLPPKCQMVFSLLYIHELSPKEVASQLKVSLENVYSQKKLALKRLRIALIDISLTMVWWFIYHLTSSMSS